MPKRTQDHRSWQLEKLSDPRLAANYLNAAISDSPEMFLEALRNVAQARQMAKVAKESGIARESLYRALSDQGNPTLETLRSILSVVGLKIAIQPEAEPSFSPQVLVSQTRASRPRASRSAFAYHGAGQLQLSFISEVAFTSASAGSDTLSNVVARRAGTATTRYISNSLNARYGSHRDESAGQMNQEPGGLSEFFIPPANPTGFANALRP